jgi:hypothetical protein
MDFRYGDNLWNSKAQNQKEGVIKNIWVGEYSGTGKTA